MKIIQLSIFMENKVGVINEVTSILSEAGISMRAFSVADGIEFGILRLLVPDVEYAQKVIEDAGYKVTRTEVLCINVPNIAGGVSEVLNCLAKENLFIQYMYAYSDSEVASVVIRPNDIDRCVKVLKGCISELQEKNQCYSFS
ncbi:MAG: ACT domain-containing protein [Rikenellaceae bacterium]